MIETNPQEPELLPCPFCGSNGRIMTSEKLVFCMNPPCVSTGIQFRIWQTRATPPNSPLQKASASDASALLLAHVGGDSEHGEQSVTAGKTAPPKAEEQDYRVIPHQLYPSRCAGVPTKPDEQSTAKPEGCLVPRGTCGEGVRVDDSSERRQPKAEGMSALPCERCGRTFDHRQSDCEIDIQTEYENAGADLR